MDTKFQGKNILVNSKLKKKMLYVLLASPFFRYTTLCDCIEHYTARIYYNQGCLPFVRTGQPDWSVRKWNTQVLRTEKPGSGQTGTAHKVGPLSSLGPARNARSEWPNSWRHGYFFSLFKGWPTKCICSPGAKKIASSSNIVNVIQKWLLKPSKW